jgi:hypothetical protein
MRIPFCDQSDAAGTMAPVQWTSITFIDDVFRHAFWPAKEFFYELLGAPLQAVLGQPMPMSVRRQMWQNGTLRQEGSALPKGPETAWLNEYATLSPDSRRTLSAYVDPRALHICYEASPGLLDFLTERGVTYIDIRLSPIRFLPDVVLAITSNSSDIRAKLSRISLPRHEIVTEATKLSAAFRHRDRYVPQANIPRRPGRQVVVIGQTASDASIIVDGRFFHFRDALSTLHQKLQGAHVLYLRHPSASPEHIRSETDLLRGIYPALEVTTANSYDLLCCDQSLEFLGISSGLMQEAAFFGRATTSLLPPVCPLVFSDTPESAQGYAQVTFDTFMDPQFWRCLLGAAEPDHRDTLRTMVPNQLRELHNVWWGYPAHKIKPNDFNRTLTGDIRPELERVYGTTRFVLDIIAGNQPSIVGDDITSRHWRWPSGGVVKLEPDGIVTRDNRKAGTWRRLALSEPAYFLLWDEGFWVDFVRYAGNGRLVCRNNIGGQFAVAQA